MPLPSATTLATLWDKLAGLVIGIGFLEQNLGAQGPQNTLPPPVVPSPPGAVFGQEGAPRLCAAHTLADQRQPSILH